MLAVDGPSGAGKSTLAAAVVAELGERAALVSTDAFATWDNLVAWWPQLERGVLEPLSLGRAGEYRQVDWTSGEPRPGALVTVGVPEVLVLEGVSGGRRAMRSRLAHLCWIEGGTEAERLERAVARDGEASRADLRRWQLFEQGWFAVDGTRESAQTRLP
ncbi:uridine kinase [Amycolatopsis rhabdoformis]|uniref:Uridine kinase n=1 Tax=Amycolatopsis rhabdoformis TaxID=1448059 RepID=A0ABZ1I0Y7_9PSEU|nr:uridine kinase [Amycolatopsis rhabdoformis]WSE27875.1 uridine kinase [Amycolatopsis rhabdoformis]